MKKIDNFLKNRLFDFKEILLVDDEEDLGWILQKVFSDIGYKFIFASTIKDGLKKVKKYENLDVAIIDFKIDKDNGFDFIRKAKKINSEVEFIMISAFGDLDIKEKAKQSGIKYFLDKPLNLDKLLSIISC
ncbi:MAG: response regulator [Candidatus Firestonebacteria bacterium]|nr:response regulator [Candidatus Firestonebacteria bacterium]